MAEAQKKQVQRNSFLGRHVIELDNLAYSYGGGELLSAVSLKLAPG